MSLETDLRLGLNDLVRLKNTGRNYPSLYSPPNHQTSCKMQSILFSYLRSYAICYVIVVMCFIVFVYTEYFLVPRFENTRFKLNNTHIAKSYVANEVMSGVEVIFLSTFMTALIVAWHCLLGVLSLRKVKDIDIKGSSVNTNKTRPRFMTNERHLLHVSLLCMTLILTINGVVTNCLKLLIGNLRPDFLDRCQPNLADVKDANAWVTLDICQQSNKGILYEGLKSTPSGHSSFITSGMGFLFLWQSYFISGPKIRHIWCPIVAIIVMISRLTDHRHHWYDVLSGSFLGMSIVMICWKWIIVKKYHPPILPQPVAL